VKLKNRKPKEWAAKGEDKTRIVLPVIKNRANLLLVSYEKVNK
jgi:hypothetical protein